LPDDLIPVYREKLAKAKEYILAIRDKLKGQVKRATDAEASVEHSQAELRTRESQLAVLSDKMASAVQEASELRAKLNDSEPKRIAAEEKCEQLEAKLAEATEARARLKKEGEEQFNKAVQLQRRCRDLLSQAKKNDLTHKDAMDELDASRERIKSLQDRMQQLGVEAQGAKQAHHTARSTAEQANKEAAAAADLAE